MTSLPVRFIRTLVPRALLTAAMLLVFLGSLCHRPEEVPALVAVNISHNSGRSEDPHLVVDSQGTVHVVWRDDTDGEGILYAYKPRDGQWTEPLRLTSPRCGGRLPSIAVGPGDRLHVAWQGTYPDRTYWFVLYSYKDAWGDWAVPETIIGDEHYVRPCLAIDTAGCVHLTWLAGGYASYLDYAMRDVSGNWSEPITLTDRDSVVCLEQEMCADECGTVYLAIDGSSPSISYGTIWAARKPFGLPWTIPEEISQTKHASGCLGMAADGRGSVLVTWADGTAYKRGGLYRAWSEQGGWDSAQFVFDCTLNLFQYNRCLAASPEGALYIPACIRVPGQDVETLQVVVKTAGSVWSEPITCGQVRPPNSLDPQKMACDREGRSYIVSEKSAYQQDSSSLDIFCMQFDLERSTR